MLQHGGMMARGVRRLQVTVVPGSGTGALAHLTGTLSIDVGGDGAHAHRFDYAIADE